MVLICVSLITSTAEHLSTCLLAIHVFFGEITISDLCPFLSAWMLLLLLSCGCSLYIVGTNPHQTYESQAPPPVCRLSFDSVPSCPVFPATPFITILGQESTLWTHLWSASPGLFGATALLTGTGARWEGEGRGARGQAGTAHGHRRAAWGGRPQGPRVRSRQWAKGVEWPPTGTPLSLFTA